MSDLIISTRAPRRFGRAAFALLALLLVTVVFQTSAQADPLILTAGEIIIDRGPNRFAGVGLRAQNFSVTFSTDLNFPSGPFGGGNFSTNTVGCSCDSLGQASFEGFMTQNFSGSGRFDTMTVTGRINFYAAGFPTGTPLFTIDYIGMGYLAVDTPMLTRFVITGGTPSGVPEPATLLLLGTGLAGVAARARKRRRGGRAGEESPPA